MRLRSQLILPAVLLAMGAAPALAQTQGRIVAKVKAKADGSPVAGATVVMKRTDRNWSKEFTTDAKGQFSQAGLDPNNFEVTITAPGFAPFRESVKIPMGDTLQKEFLLEKPGAATTTTGTQTAPDTEGYAEETEARAALDAARPLYAEHKYAEALPYFDSCLAKLKESLAKTKDESAKAALQQMVQMSSRARAFCLTEVGKFADARPFMEETFARNEPEAKLDKSKWDQPVVQAMVKICQGMKDAEGEKKYQAIIDSIVGPRPEVAYNEGVNAFNANRMKEARTHLLKAISINPQFPDSYYMMGLVELNSGNMGGAKQNFRKYLELAPSGKYASEVKDTLHAL